MRATQPPGWFLQPCTTHWAEMAKPDKSSVDKGLLSLGLCFASKSVSNLHSNVSAFYEPSLHRVALIDTALLSLSSLMASKICPLHRCLSAQPLCSHTHQHRSHQHDGGNDTTCHYHEPHHKQSSSIRSNGICKQLAEHFLLLAGKRLWLEDFALILFSIDGWLKHTERWCNQRRPLIGLR